MNDGVSETRGRQVDMNHSMNLRVEWRNLLSEIRSKEGFQNFLRGRLHAEYLRAGDQGPVLVLIPSVLGCYGLIIYDSQIEAVEFKFTFGDLVNLANGFTKSRRRVAQTERELVKARAVAEREDGTNADRHRYQRAKQDVHTERIRANGHLRDLLDTLWLTIMQPVIARLCLHDTANLSSLSRLWICPAGPFTALPLHAAEAKTSDPRSFDSLLRCAIASYTPSIRALLGSRDRSPVHLWTDEGSQVTGLAVVMEETSGEVPLSNGKAEVQAFKRLLQPNAVKVLAGHRATRGNVRDNLRVSHVAHFSCHGLQNLFDPTAGGLLVHDGLLTVDQIGSSHYEGQLAFLSACETAATGPAIPDEAMTLASALHHRGYRQVIACMWSVYDPAAADIVAGTYASLRSGCDGLSAAAYALHDAIHEQRSARPEFPGLWAPFAHTGP